MKHYLKSLIPGLAVFWFTSSLAQTKGIQDNLSASLVVQYSSALEYKNAKFQKNEFILKPSITYDLGKRAKLFGAARIYTELNDNLEAGVPSQNSISEFSKRLFIGDRSEFEIRELYLDWYVGKRSALRVGKQQIVWGETDGLKLLDVVNPQSFREFILDDFEDSRIPLWSAKMEFPLTKSVDAQLIWIPDQTYHFIPSFDAPFFPGAVVPIPPEGIPFDFSPLRKPGGFFKDSEVGVKLSSFINGWDLTLNYLFHHDDLPNFVINYNPQRETPILIDQQYNRTHLIGATFNKAVGSFVLRGETAFNINRNFNLRNLFENGGITKSNQVLNTFGLDWISGEWVASFQIFNDFLFRDMNFYNRDRLESNWTFLLSHELMNDNLKIEFLSIQNINQGDWLLRPKTSYFISSNIELDLGADLFLGSQSGLYGQFKDSSRMFLSLKLGL